MYKAPPAHALTEEFYETDPRRDFARGFAIQTVGPLPIAFAKQMMTAKGAWGWGLRRVMMDYNHWAAIRVAGRNSAVAGEPGTACRGQGPVRHPGCQGYLWSA